MSLTRKKLKAFGLTEEQVDSVIEEHIDTVKALQDDVATYKADAEKLPSVQKELDDLKAEKGDSWKKKYEDEHAAFEKFKTEQGEKDTKAAKERAFREIIKAAGISEKRREAVFKISNLDELELDADGKAKNGDAITKKIKEEFSDFVEEVSERGANVSTPPGNVGGKMTKKEIMAIKDYKERQAAIERNPEQFLNS